MGYTRDLAKQLAMQNTPTEEDGLRSRISVLEGLVAGYSRVPCLPWWKCRCDEISRALAAGKVADIYCAAHGTHLTITVSR